MFPRGLRHKRLKQYCSLRAEIQIRECFDKIKCFPFNPHLCVGSEKQSGSLITRWECKAVVASCNLRQMLWLRQNYAIFCSPVCPWMKHFFRRGKHRESRQTRNRSQKCALFSARCRLNESHKPQSISIAINAPLWEENFLDYLNACYKQTSIEVLSENQVVRCSFSFSLHTWTLVHEAAGSNFVHFVIST